MPKKIYPWTLQDPYTDFVPPEAQEETDNILELNPFRHTIKTVFIYISIYVVQHTHKIGVRWSSVHGSEFRGFISRILQTKNKK